MKHQQAGSASNGSDVVGERPRDSVALRLEPSRCRAVHWYLRGAAADEGAGRGWCCCWLVLKQPVLFRTTYYAKEWLSSGSDFIEITSYFGVIDYPCADIIMANVSVRLADTLAQFDGKGDFAEWLRKLERVAKLQKIDDLASFLPLFLTGGAYAVYEGVSEPDKEDYAKVKSALLSAFSPNQFDAFEELMTRRLGDGESVDVYYAVLSRLASIVADNWVRCAFVAGLPEPERKQLRSLCALSSLPMTDVIEKARELMHRQTVSYAATATAKEPNSTATTLRQRIVCWNCNMEGHVSRYCRNKPSQRRRCFVCGDESHLAVACPERRRDLHSKNE